LEATTCATICTTKYNHLAVMRVPGAKRAARSN
jgi:hypothetical protein